MNTEQVWALSRLAAAKRQKMAGNGTCWRFRILARLSDGGLERGPSRQQSIRQSANPLWAGRSRLSDGSERYKSARFQQEAARCGPVRRLSASFPRRGIVFSSCLGITNSHTSRRSASQERETCRRRLSVQFGANLVRLGGARQRWSPLTLIKVTKYSFRSERRLAAHTQ